MTRRWQRVTMVCLTVAMAAAFLLPAQADNFSAGAKVNVLQWYDFFGVKEPAPPPGFTARPSDPPPSYIRTWVDWRFYTDGGPSRSVWGAIDGGQNHTQINHHSVSANNYGCLDLVLPETISINQIFTEFAQMPVTYTLWYSTTGFDNMQKLTPTQAYGTNTSKTDTFASTPVKYLRLEYTGTDPDRYVIIREIRAFAADPTSIGLNAGFNIMNDPVVNSIPVDRSNPLHFGGDWQGDDPNWVFNTESYQYLRGAGSSGERFFVKELGVSMPLSGASFGFYEDQSWNDLTIWVTADKTVTDDTVWVLAGSTNGPTGLYGSIKFDAVVNTMDVQFIKVVSSGTNTGALCHLGLYGVSIPEPATMSLLVLGGMAMLRRRK